MIDTRWKKVLRDLSSSKIRTVLVMLTIAVGVFATGFVSISFDRLMTDMDADYQSVNPHGAMIFTEPFDDDFLASLEKVPGVGAVEGRSSASGRVLHGEEKIIIGITAIPPVAEMQIDRLRTADGTGTLPPLDDREIFIERTALMGLPVQAGDRVTIEFNGGLQRELRVAAIVHDVASFPFVFTQQASGYVTPETMAWLGGTRDFNTIYLTVRENKTDEEHVRTVAAAVADKVERSGREVYFTQVYQPGRHFASDITRSLGVMMGFLGALSVGLSGFLVVNTINALLGQHVRQIGVMKAIGAKTMQLLAMYLALVLVFGLLSLLVAVPLSALAADFITDGTSAYLNFNPGEFRIPLFSVILQVVVAVAVPVAAALLPVVRWSRITIREAISSYGLGQGHFGKGLLDRMVEKIQGLPRPLLLSLRNTFRRKARLALTLSTLIIAGAIFVSVFNLRASMNVAINETLGYILSDVNIGFTKPYRLQKVAPLAEQVPGVERVEGWSTSLGEVLSADRQTANQIIILAPPADSTLIDPSLTSGRWLRPEDENGLVIGNHLLAERPDLKTGDEIILRINEKETTWKIVGTFKMAGNVSPPPVYANYEYLTRLQGNTDQVAELRILTSGHDLTTQRRVADQLESVYKQVGIEIGSATLGQQVVAQNTSQINILVYFLLAMAALIALVGGLGLMSTMSMNVLERTREIGVIRAVGATDGSIIQLVIVEGVLIGLISWAFGALLAVPIGIPLSNVVGIAFLRSPMPLVFARDGVLVWLAVVVTLSTLASVLPARNAARLTVRETLAYE